MLISVDISCVGNLEVYGLKLISMESSCHFKFTGTMIVIFYHIPGRNVGYGVYLNI